MSKLTRLPIIKKIWFKIRENRILKKHNEVSQYWKKIIDLYIQNKLQKYSFEKKKKIETEKIIWQYWGQGIQDANIPEVVSICFDSVDKYKEDYLVIRLDDTNISEYIDLPSFILEKLSLGIISKTFLSDLLRVILLKTYGGIWLDATILLTDKIPNYLKQGNHFVFQRDPSVVEKKLWKNSYAYYWNWNPRFKVNMLNSIFYSKQNDVMVSTISDLLLHYWQNNNVVIDYFFFQILYDNLIDDVFKAQRCPIISDTKPHLLQVKLNGGFEELNYKDILNQSSIHKMSYFDQSGVDRMNDFLNNL
jgi:hypothetical protein